MQDKPSIRLAKLTVQRKHIDIRIAQLQQIVYVSNHPEQFSGALVQTALCDDLNMDYNRWDGLWKQEMDRRGLNSDTYLNGVWNRIEKKS